MNQKEENKMTTLTFGEQVKIILKRKGMTIKELAEMVEQYTGKPMSRQNMTQRLGRDNFQEQDMRMIADILGCEFVLNIMEPSMQETVVEEVKVEEDRPEEKAVEKETEKKSLRQGVKEYFRRSASSKSTQPVDLGEINPYTRKEYETNSVRIHPKRIGYVQVYDRETHKWTEMTEWAFLGYQERKKKLLGKDYKPPVYLD